MKTYDAIIIGSGVSGLSAAYGLKEAGKTVLVVE
ncbi:FAD-binding oxidoreductase, partial [Enterococcus faecium]